MAKLLVFLLILLACDPKFSFSEISPSPAPPPESGLDSPPPHSDSHSPSSSPPSPSPANPPSNANPPSDSPDSSPNPSPDDDYEPEEPLAPVPAPDGVAADVNRETVLPEKSSSKEGTSAGKKAGIVVGVMVGAGLVGLGGFVYKKRQDNIRRARYATDTRSAFL